MLPLDFHAHLHPGIQPGAIVDLSACVVAVTRSLREFAQVADRSETSVTWCVGVHPSVPMSHTEFSVGRFSDLLGKTPIVGEIGLDKSSPVSQKDQLNTFETILATVAETPRILNIHSAGSSKLMIEIIDAYRPKGVVLHWWRGTIAETERALDLGCSFSINSAEIARPRIMNVLPRDRVLTETDHPFGDRNETGRRRPGRLDNVESALAEQWNVEVSGARRQVWKNLLDIVDATDTGTMFPAIFRRSMLAV